MSLNSTQLGVHRLPSALGAGGTSQPAGGWVWVDSSGNVTVEANLTVDGVLVVSGGETFVGLVTITSTSGAGAAGVLGGQEVEITNTQAATAGATIRNPGYIDWAGQYWDGAATATGRLGRFGAVCDTQVAGVPTVYRLAWTDAAGAIQWSVDQAGHTLQTGVAYGPDGTIAAPTWAFTSDVDTGAYLAAVGHYGIAVGGVQRVDVDATRVMFTSATGAGAAGVLGPVLGGLQNTEAATVGATIKNPGALTFEGRTWETTGGTSTTQAFGQLGGVIDSITAATGAPLTYRLAWATTAGAIKWDVDEVGDTTQAGNMILPCVANVASPTACKWRMLRETTTLNGENDYVWRVSYNDAQGDDATQIAWGQQMEATYYDGVARQSEWILSYTSAAGVGFRPYQVNVMHDGADADKALHMIKGHVQIYPSAAGANPWVIFGDAFASGVPSKTLYVQDSGVISTPNAVQTYKQRTSVAGVDSTLAYLDASNRWLWAPGGEEVNVTGAVTIGAGALGSVYSKLHVQPSITATAALQTAEYHNPQVTQSTANDFYGCQYATTYAVADGIAAPRLQNIRIDAPSVTLGAGSSLVEATTVYIQGSPSAGTTTYALVVDNANSGGHARFTQVGAVAKPTIAIGAATDLGFYQAAANVIGLTASSVQVARFGHDYSQIAGVYTQISGICYASRFESVASQEAVTIVPYGAAAGNTGELRLRELAANGTDYVAHKAADAVTSYTLTWPGAVAGGANYSLVSDASGVLSWYNAPGTYAPIGASYITVSAEGGLSGESVLAGTTNQITLTPGAGTMTLSTPQDIATASSVTFANLTLGTGGALRTGTTLGNTLLLQAYDNDTGPGYETFVTLTAGNTPTCDLATGVTIGGAYVYRASGTDVPVADGGTGLSTFGGVGTVLFTSAADTLTSAAGFTYVAGVLSAPAVVTSAQAGVTLGPYGASAGNTGELRLLELAANGTHYTAIKVADALTASDTYTLPSAYPGASGYALTSTTAGVMSWAAHEALTDSATASANDITLPANQRSHEITGTTDVQRIATAGWTAGAIFCLRFTNAAPGDVIDGTASGGGYGKINMIGSVNFDPAQYDRIFLFFDGTEFWEIAQGGY